MKEISLNEENLKKLYLKGEKWFFRLYVKKYYPESNLWEECDTNLLLNRYLMPNFSISKLGEQFLEEIIGKVSNKIDISNKWHELHKELQGELLKLTGKKQAKANGDYPFLCNEQDLQHKLSKVITKYKLTDWEKIKKLLILHVRKAHKQKFEKVFLLQYYVEKNGMSTLASDYENFLDKEEGVVKKEVILTNTKELF